MEVNKEEALRCLSIAQKHRNGGNLTSAIKFAKKSVSLYSTPEGNAMVTIVEREISVSSTNGSAPASSGASTPQGTAKASGVEEHVTSAHQRPGHKTAAGAANAEASGSGTKKREYTPKQMEVVKRVKSCQHHEYYKILAGKLPELRLAKGMSELTIQWRSLVKRQMSSGHTKRCVLLA